MAPANPGAQRGKVLASDKNASTSTGGRARARRTFPQLGGDSDRGGGVADRRVRLSRWTGWSGRTRLASSRAEEQPGRLCQRSDRRSVGPRGGRNTRSCEGDDDCRVEVLPEQHAGLGDGQQGLDQVDLADLCDPIACQPAVPGEDPRYMLTTAV